MREHTRIDHRILHRIIPLPGSLVGSDLVCSVLVCSVLAIESLLALLDHIFETYTGYSISLSALSNNGQVGIKVRSAENQAFSKDG
jgi:hypothetical protein